MNSEGTHGQHRVGWFRYYFDDDRWEWSDEVQLIHGYAPGAVAPTTDLVLSHKHPDDRNTIASTLEDIRQTRRPLTSRHRIIDTHGKCHSVLLAGNELVDDAGRVIGTHGFYVDVTPQETRSQDNITKAVAEIAENRAPIEQAKGMLMLLYGLSDELAFDLLRWRSQETNTKLRTLAEQVVTDFRSLATAESLPERNAYDAMLMTAHERA